MDPITQPESVYTLPGDDLEKKLKHLGLTLPQAELRELRMDEVAIAHLIRRRIITGRNSRIIRNILVGRALVACLKYNRPSLIQNVSTGDTDVVNKVRTMLPYPKEFTISSPLFSEKER